jgi:prolipoprotein diacylglyceryltransferase
MFEGDRELVKLRETEEKNEKLDTLTLTVFGSIIGGILVYLLVDFVSNIHRKMERITPAYTL